MRNSEPSSRRMVSGETAAGNVRPGVAKAIPADDDRYPGSFFRIPGVPAPGKTTWSANK